MKMSLFKRVFCDHDYKFERFIGGDERNARFPNNAVLTCRKCGGEKATFLETHQGIDYGIGESSNGHLPLGFVEMLRGNMHDDTACEALRYYDKNVDDLKIYPPRFLKHVAELFGTTPELMMQHKDCLPREERER